MINYEEELKKFQPCLDVDEAEGNIYKQDLTDVIDILKEMLKETNGTAKKTDELYDMPSTAQHFTLLPKVRV